MTAQNLRELERNLRELERKRDRVGVDGLTIVELLDLDAARTHIKAAARQRAEAELAILGAFDDQRCRRGHDYGGAQRYRELGRRRAEVREVDGEDYPKLEDVDVNALAAAWARVAVPRIVRLEREDYRSDTRPTRYTRQAWARVADSLAALGVEV